MHLFILQIQFYSLKYDLQIINLLIHLLRGSLSICLIGYQLTDADLKKLQSYLESIEPDRYPLIPGNKYISMLLYTVVVVTSLLCYIYIDISSTSESYCFYISQCVAFSMAIKIL